MSPTLISTKLFVPALRPRRVLRNGLLEKLDEGLELGRRLTLISAPAGFGKTMLVVEWLEHLKIMPGAPQRFGWLSLDEPDSDPQRFFTYLIAAIQCIEPEIGQDVQEMLVSPGPPNPEALLANLINTLAAIPDRFILVLDDYHLLLAEPVHQTVNFLVEHAPPQMHLVIASRADPPLNLPRLRARGQLTEIREADLRFSLDEAEDFLNQVLGLALSKAEVNALEGRTEGWIAGLQLAGLAIKSMDSSTTSNAGPPTSKATFIQSFSGSNRYILDYLMEEVLNRQPLSIQEFLLQTAILERMCGPLCEAVTGKPAGQETLERLESDHLFILPLDSERHWFRYHHLFRDLLHHRARQILGERLYSLHHQASKWFGQQGLTSEAISHAIHAGELEDAIRLVEDHAVQALARGEIYALKGWLEALPEDVRLASPWLRIFEAWVSLLTGQMEAIEAWLPQAQEWRTIECDPQYSPEECKQMRGHSAAIRAYASTINGDIAGAVKPGKRLSSFCRQRIWSCAVL